MSNIFNINLNDEDDFDSKLNMDELYESKQQKDLAKLNIFKKILNRVHIKIKSSNRMSNMKLCWYIVPEVILGVPYYDQVACIEFLVKQLEENGFIVRYNHPNVLFISWNHWIPTYIRNEIKKKTGVEIDGFGNVVEKNENNTLQPLTTNTNTNENTNKKNFKDISTYKPTGKFIYDQIFK